MSAANLLRADGTERSDGWRRWSCFAQELAGKRQARSRPGKENNEVEAEYFVLRWGSERDVAKVIEI